MISEFFAEVNCPVCDSNDKKVVFKDLVHTCNVLKKSRISFTNEEAKSDICSCNQCGHKYLTPVIKGEFIKYYYEEAGSEYYDSVIENPRDRIAEDTKQMAELISKECIDCKTVLEIGSGMGYLLEQLKQRGFECTGVDPSSFASKFAREAFGLNILTQMLDYETFPEKKFDIIIMCDVVEHIYDINSLILLAKHYLSENGRIVILTGNSNSLYAKVCGRKWLYFFSWEHISFFNKSSISYLFKKHSLQIQYFKAKQHSGSYWHNVKVFALTIKAMLAIRLGLRNYPFLYMSFDHLLTIGKNGK